MRTLLTLSVMLVAGTSADALAQKKSTAAKPDSGCVTFAEGRVECVKLRAMLGDSGFQRMKLRTMLGDSGFQKMKLRTMKGDSGFRKIVFRNDSAMMKRAALGLELRATGTRRDTLGVFVAAVTSGGPAETAGIIEGDRIASINGVDLRSAAADVDDEYTNGVPAHRLTREVQKLTPGTRVTLRVFSGGRSRDVVVTAGRASDVFRQAGQFNFRMQGPGGMEFRRPDGAMMFTPEMPLRIERFGPPGRTQIRTLPRKIRREVVA